MIAIVNPQQRKYSGIWYVLITKQPGVGFNWASIPLENYDFYEKHFVIERDYEIIAGPYSISEQVLDRITGCNAKGEEIGSKHLEELVRRLNMHEEVNAQYELERLIKGN